jgi:hypothetical protein
MNPDFEPDADEPWAIPLHGAIVPFPASEPPATIAFSGETADEPPPSIPLRPEDDEIPSEGYFPQLRRFGDAA